MRKRSYAVFAALLLCVLMVGVVSAAETPVEVSTWGELTSNLTNLAVTEIRLTGDIEAESRINVQHNVVIDGQYHTLSAKTDFGTDNDKKHLLCIGSAATGVTLKNLILDSKSFAFGAQVYATGTGNEMKLENLVLNGSKGSGLTINGAVVSAKNLTIQNSAWMQSIDVSSGQNVDFASTLTIDSLENLKDLLKIIWDHGAKDNVNEGTMVTIGDTPEPGYDYWLDGDQGKHVWGDLHEGSPAAAKVTASDDTFAYYNLLPQAVTAADDGAIIEILNDVEIRTSLVITKNISIDGGYHTLTATDCAAIHIQNDLEELEITNLKIQGNSSKKNYQAGEVMADPYMGIGTYNLGCPIENLTLINVVIDGCDYGLYFGADSNVPGPVVIDANNLTIQNCYIKGAYFEKLSESTFKSCIFTNNGHDTGKVVVSDFQKWMAGVDVNLKYGDYENIAFTECTFTNNGANRGTALLIKARGTGSDSTYSATPATLVGVTVTDCVFTGNNAVNTDNGNAFGPIVLGEPGKDNLYPIDVTIQDGVGVTDNRGITVILTRDEDEDPEPYATLPEAVDAAMTDAVILTLQKDASGDGVVVSSGSNITLDLNGYTYTIDGRTVGSTGTETNGFQLLRDSDVTIKNGTITSDKAKLLIQNYCNLTLDNVTLDGSQLVGTKPYTSSNNCGNTVFKNGTRVIAKSGGYAFDSFYSPPSYSDGVTVTIEDDVFIEGDFEAARKSGDKDGVIIIKGGKFTMDPTTYVADGYTTIFDGTFYYVVTAIAGPSTVTPGTPVIFSTKNIPGIYAWTVNGTLIAGYTGNTLEYTFVGEDAAYDKKIGVTVTDEGKITAKGELTVTVQKKKEVPKGEDQVPVKPAEPTTPGATKAKNVTEVVFGTSDKSDAGNIVVTVTDDTKTPVTGSSGEETTKQEAYKQVIPNATEVLQVLNFDVQGTAGESNDLQEMAIIKFSVWRPTPLGPTEKIVAYRFSETAGIEAMPLETTYVLNATAPLFTYDCTALTPGFSDIAVSIVSTPEAKDTYLIPQLNAYRTELGPYGIIRGQDFVVPVNLNLTEGAISSWKIKTTVKNASNVEAPYLTYSYTSPTGIIGEAVNGKPAEYEIFTSPETTTDVTPLFTLTLGNTSSLTENEDYTVTISIDGNLAASGGDSGGNIVKYSQKTLTLPFVAIDWLVEDPVNTTYSDDKFGNTEWYLNSPATTTMIVRPLDYISTGDDLWPTVTRNASAGYTKKTANLSTCTIMKTSGTHDPTKPTEEWTWIPAEGTTVIRTDDGHIEVVKHSDDQDAFYFRLIFTGNRVGDVIDDGTQANLGKVDIYDADMIAHTSVHATGYVPVEKMPYADADHDGAITIGDAKIAFYWGLGYTDRLGIPNSVYLPDPATP